MANVAKVLDALGDPTRRRIFELVGARAGSVQEIAERMPVSRPAVSQHLKVLKDAGLVAVRSEGTRRYYEIHGAGIEALRAYLDRFWDDALERFAKAAEAAARKGKT